MLDDSNQPTPEAPLPTNDLTSEKELKDEKFLLKQKVKRLEQELEGYKGRIQLEDTIAKEVGWLGLNVFKRFFLGSQLFEKTQNLWNSYSTWVKTGERKQLEPATRDFSVALLVRLLRLSAVGLVLAVIPTVFVITQTFLLYFQNQKIDRQNDLVGTQNVLLRQQNDLVLNQNEKFDVQNELVKRQTTLLARQNDLAKKQEKLLEEQNDLFANQNNSLLSQNELIANQSKQIDAQNEKIDRQVVLQAYEQTIKFREILRLLPFDEDNKVIKNYPDTEVKVAFWPAPKESTVEQITILGEKIPELVILGLKPLLTDEEPTVAAGALLVIQRLINNKDQVVQLTAKKALRPDLKPEEFIFGLRVNLNKIQQIYLVGADLRGVFLKGCDFSYAYKVKAGSLGLHILAEQEGYKIPKDSSIVVSNLSGVILVAANLKGADLEFVDLKYADLRLADLRKVFLGGALLENANFKGADLREAYVYKKDGRKSLITPEYLKFQGAIFDETTKFSGPSHDN